MNTNHVICIIGCVLGLCSHSSAADLQFLQSNSGINTRLNGVTVGDDRFVAVGTNSTVSSSTVGPGGLIWNPSSAPANGLTNSLNLWAVTHGDALFVTSGATNLVYSSPDGGHWDFESQTSPGFTRSVRGLSFNNGTYVAVLGDASDIRWTGVSLNPWTRATLSPLTGGERYRSVTIFGTNGFAACGMLGLIRVSLDSGRTWGLNNGPSSSEPELLGIGYGAGKLVCVGANGRIMVSSNLGTNWTVSTVGTANLNAVAYTGSEFVVVGDNGVILHSANATNWLTYSSPVITNLLGVACATQGALQGATVIVGEAGTVLIGSEVPAEPTGANNPTTCSDGAMEALTVDVPPGVTVDWYATETSETPLDGGIGTTSYTPTDKVTATYYAEARNRATGFASTTRTPVTLTVNPTVVLSETHVNVGCFGESTGSIDVSVTGGTAPYAYKWSDGPTTQDRAGLPAGAYSVTVTDAILCTAELSVTITQPAAALVPSQTHVNVLCFGESTGSIDVSVTGGTAPYAYKWSDGPTTQDRAGLPAGAYSVTVTDANSCTAILPVTITQPAAPLTLSETNDCSLIDLTVTGGTAPYTYVWSPGGETTQDLSGITNGTYSVTVTDANGCTAPLTITISCKVTLEYTYDAAKRELTLSWPEGCTLESTPTLTNPDWQEVPGGGNNSVTVKVEDTGNRFYRLKK
jgi:hypothetical protein